MSFVITKFYDFRNTKNDLDNIEELLEADDVMYIIADRKRSKTDVNLENSTRSLNNDDVI